MEANESGVKRWPVWHVSTTTEKLRHGAPDEDDDDAVWIIPGGDSLPDSSAGLPAVSPWRSPAVLRQSRDVRVKGLLRAARGQSLFGIVDLKVLVWIGCHISLPLLLICIDADVRSLFRVAFSADSASAAATTPPAALGEGHDKASVATAAMIAAAAALSNSHLYGQGGGGGSRCTGLLCSERLQVVTMVVLAAASLGLFASLYCSDPGWIQPGSPAVDSDPQRPPCALCGEVPSLRSHHDKHTGQCVHKHDHHCWALSATIGDRNHSRFMALLAVEATLLGWLLVRAVPTALRCSALWWLNDLLLRRGWSSPLLASGGVAAGGGAGAGGGGGCSAAPGLLRLGLLWGVVLFAAACLVLVGHLLLLHAYLAATNQTTLELIKGPRLPFLARAYAAVPSSQCGPGGRPPSMLDGRGNVSLGRIAQQHVLGATPPRPFDEGLRRNLGIFFLAPKPYPYRLRTSAFEAA